MNKEPDDKLPPEYLGILKKLKTVIIWAVILFISMVILLIIVSQSAVLTISSSQDNILYTAIDLSIFFIIVSALMYKINNLLLDKTLSLNTKLFRLGELLSSRKLSLCLIFFPIPLLSLFSSYGNVVWAALVFLYAFITYAPVYLYLRRLSKREAFKGTYETYNPQQSYKSRIKAIRRRDILLISAFLAGLGPVFFFIGGFYNTVNSLCPGIAVGFLSGVKGYLQPHLKVQPL